LTVGFEISAQRMDKVNLAIVGAAGAVGKEILRSLEHYKVPIDKLKLFGGSRSIGTSLEYAGTNYTVEETNGDSFKDTNFALFSAGSSISKKFRDHCKQSNCVIIDNSSAFRMEEGVPLVVPEINPESLKEHTGVIANPNCSTIILLMAIEPLRRLKKIKRLFVSTYQAASGAGQEAMNELLLATRSFLDGTKFSPKIMPVDYAFNFFSHNSNINDVGRNEEEQKMISESKKILSDEAVKIFVTCIRVPVLRAHGESIIIEFDGPAPSVDDAKNALKISPGIKIIDDREKNRFPTPREVSDGFDVAVGRIRHSDEDPNTLELFVVGDQLLKGAAQNAVQILKELLK
jgi:aspartate-semialdehyde dehydrogenase